MIIFFNYLSWSYSDHNFYCFDFIVVIVVDSDKEVSVEREKLFDKFTDNISGFYDKYY